MVCKQCIEIECDEIDDLAGLKERIDGIQTDGTIHAVSIEIEADAPIYSLPPTLTPAEGNSQPDPTQTTSHSQPTTDTETASDNSATPVDALGPTEPAEAENRAQTASSAGTEPPTEIVSTNESASEPAVEAEIETETEDTAETDVEAETDGATADETESDGPVPTVGMRKWPRLSQTIDIDLDLPISAGAFPTETQDFYGNKNADVEHDVAYHATVNGHGRNGSGTYGIFVTLNGSGFNPKAKYEETTGLIHRENLLNGNAPQDFKQGDTVVVELNTHTEKGLSFRELPMLSMDQAEQVRNLELARLENLRIEEGDTITFSRWQRTKEYTGEILEIKYGQDNPPKPPRIHVRGRGAGTEYWVQPSEIVADDRVVAEVEEQAADKYADTLEEIIGTTDTDTTTETEVEAEIEAETDESETTDDTAPTATTGPDSRPMTATPEDSETAPETTASPESADTPASVEDADSEAAEAAGEDDSDDGDAEDEDDYECVCGEEFDSSPALRGHYRWCDEYKALKEDGDADADDESADTTAMAATTDGGTVVNPILLNPTYKYPKIAVALYQADETRLGIRDIADLMADTEWEISYNNVTPHLKSLMKKGVVERHDDDGKVYTYSLTARGRAGVETFIDEMGDAVPTFALDAESGIEVAAE